VNKRRASGKYWTPYLFLQYPDEFYIFEFMSTADLKLNLHQLIDGVSDNSVLEAVYTLLSKATANQEDWYDSLSEKDRASIERGLEDLKNDRIVSHEMAMKRISEKVSRLKNG